MSDQPEELIAWYLKNDPSQVPQSKYLRSMIRTSIQHPMCFTSDDHILCMKTAQEVSSAVDSKISHKKTLKRLSDDLLPDFSYLSDLIPNEFLGDVPSFAQTLAFAEDLSLSYSAGIKAGQAMVPITQPSVPLSSIPSLPKSNTRQNFMESNFANSRSPQEEEIDNGTKKKNPFSSAKERFQQEGGKLPPSATAAKKVDHSGVGKGQPSVSNQSKSGENDDLPPELANCDKALVEKIEADIIHHGHPITFADIAGLEFAKECVIETICWPMTQPQLFQGLRSLPRGVLLFGPPGTGKTLIGKAIAHQSGATFFSISASSLMSKWIGEGEKTVRTLFAVAAYRQPSVVFIDEVDSLLCQRSADENEASRRIKTEFMVQLDGANTNLDARVVIIGATNRPEELDEAVRRRFVKRLYIPLPDDLSRRELIKTLVKDVRHNLTPQDIEELTVKTDGYSGADIRNLCTEAAMGPIRQLAQRSRGNLTNITSEDVPAITFAHFHMALETVTPSVSQSDLQRYLEWNSLYGSFKRQK